MLTITALQYVLSIFSINFYLNFIMVVIENIMRNAYQVTPRVSSRQAARRTRFIVFFVSVCRGESVRDRTYCWCLGAD
jgi:membrane-anchored glycerophosphoryl diester phosphodiesterase (GDPDase)